MLGAFVAVLGVVGTAECAMAETFSADPTTYVALIDRLRPGDRLQLEPGSYRDGLVLTGLHGAADRPIVISGPPDRSAVILGRPEVNTVELRDVSYLEIRNLTLDGRNIPRIDGVKAQDVTHHIALENLAIINHGTHQQTVGISTKAPAWDWVIRNNVIKGAGTGLYLGNSNGRAPFVRGLIEHNVIVDTIGYGLQIKHQGTRDDVAGMPTEPSSTIIRYNVISKASQPEKGFQGPRPNLLVGHFPRSGAGEQDLYEIYGNVLYQNLVGEPLFQGEGNVAFHDNLLINDHGDGIVIRPHNDVPKRIEIFHNTVVAKNRGIVVTEPDPRFEQSVFGNAVFAASPIVAPAQSENVTDGFAAAADYLRRPFGVWADLDLRPRPGRLAGRGLDLAGVAGLADYDKDVAGNPRTGDVRGAYAGDGVATGPYFSVPVQP